MVKGLDFILLNRVRESLDKDKPDVDAEFEAALQKQKREQDRPKKRRMTNKVP
eukprot:TRINITY_DN125_c0_g1_i4.p5 TRINITY_DN125_c0_g1~~TRINITY_DN125_c0_g1_i4.p5  ORF type:complete len:53 (+),score=11.93 TRINITY_DN125_c0_g1_i4:639-797(+)